MSRGRTAAELVGDFFFSFENIFSEPLTTLLASLMLENLF